jgi:hypothetical protein
MKIMIRLFILSVVLAGIAAAASMPKTAVIQPSHQSATGHFQTPDCGNDPDNPICPQQ